MKLDEFPIRSLKVTAFKIPTDFPESDGTMEWDSTTLILVKIIAGGKEGVGFTYGHSSVGEIIQNTLVTSLLGADAFDIPILWEKMVESVRNIGLRGIASHAISAVDCALWDLKAKLLGLPLCQLWGKAQESVPIYGSGGFTSYSSKQLSSQFERWQKKGIKEFKMKIGRFPDQDVKRIAHARKIIGPSAKLFVDANGAFSRKQALDMADHMLPYEVSWFEEPVSSDDLEGLHLLRDRVQGGMDIAAGEYGYDRFYFKTMLSAQAVDVIQADATRCGGFTGFFQACHISQSFSIPLSSHTAPALHLHACLTQNHLRSMEFFHDHARIEEKFFEGFPIVKDGKLFPHLDRNGHGLELKEAEINKYSL